MTDSPQTYRTPEIKPDAPRTYLFPGEPVAQGMVVKLIIRCETCKHWKNPWTEGEHSLAGSHVAVEEHPRWGTCQLIGLPEFAARLDHDVKAFTQDGSEYVADLHVRSDFGCILHESKPIRISGCFSPTAPGASGEG